MLVRAPRVAAPYPSASAACPMPTRTPQRSTRPSRSTDLRRRPPAERAERRAVKAAKAAKAAAAKARRVERKRELTAAKSASARATVLAEEPISPDPGAPPPRTPPAPTRLFSPTPR